MSETTKIFYHVYDKEYPPFNILFIAQTLEELKKYLVYEAQKFPEETGTWDYDFLPEKSIIELLMKDYYRCQLCVQKEKDTFLGRYEMKCHDLTYDEIFKDDIGT